MNGRQDLNALRHHILHLLEFPFLLPKFSIFFLATGDANLVMPVKNRRRFSSRRDFLSDPKMIGRTEKNRPHGNQYGSSHQMQPTLDPVIQQLPSEHFVQC